MKKKDRKPAENLKNRKLHNFFDNNIYIILAFLCSTVLMILMYYIYELIPFGTKTILRMDLYHQYGPLFAELHDRLTHFDSLIYSWNTGGGAPFTGNFYNYLSSPVGIITALLAGHKNIPEAIAVMILLKNALAASSLAYYLKKSTGRNDFSVSAFGLMYSFCGFFIAYYWNVMWIDAMYLLPLVVLGIENIIKKRTCRLYVAALALTFITSYYMAYMICIFSVIYFLVFFFSRCSFKDSYSDIPVITDENGKKTSTTANKLIYNKFLHSGVLFALSSVLAAALVAFALIPTYVCLRSCSATSGTFPEEPSLYNNIFNFLANHLASLEPTIRSSGDTVLPNVYCGMLTVILVPLYLFCDKIKAKERAAHVIMLAVFFLGFNLNFANYIIHAFHFPNDLPFRFSFIYSFILIIMAYKVLVHIRDISSKALIGSGAGVMAFIILTERFGMDNVTDQTVYISIGFTALYILVLSLMRRKDFAQTAVSLLLLCCVFSEVAIADTDHFRVSQDKENFTNGYTDFRALKESIDKHEGTDKYRMELTDINTLMDPAWFNYNGISVFSSMAYETSANLQDDLGMDSNYINSYVYHPQTPVYNAMMSLKYLVRNDGSPVNRELFEPVSQCGKFFAYKNKYYLPIAFCTDKAVKTFESDKSNPFDVQNDFWYKATGVKDTFDHIYPQDFELDNIQNIGTEIFSDSFSYSKIADNADAVITLIYSAEKTQNMYLYFQSSGIDDIDVYTDESGFSKNQSTDEAYILDCGKVRKGDTVTVEIPVPADRNSGYIECYMAGLDFDAFNAGYEVLNQSSMNIEEFSDTSIKGKIKVPKNKILYTSINYDDGWTVKIDGKEAKKFKIGNAFIGTEISEGEHTVEFSYSPKGLIIGLLISSASLGAVIAYFAVNKINEKKRQKKQKNDTFVKTYEEYSSQELAEKEKAEKVSRLKARRAERENEDNEPPTGVDALMIEDLGKNATIAQAEALLKEHDKYEEQLKKNAPTLSRADELLNTEKLDINAVMEAIDKKENSKDHEQNKEE